MKSFGLMTFEQSYQPILSDFFRLSDNLTGGICHGIENAHRQYMNAPEVEKEETIHIILKVTDKGTPALSRYKRIFVTVLPD
jgi:hypothetical protein